MATQPIPRLTEEEYLRIEGAAEYKSEFVGGELFAMPGGTRCRILNSDMRLRTPDGSQHYPDVTVACGPIQLRPSSNDILINPVLLVECFRLRPPATAGAPSLMYRLIETLRGYVVIHQDSIFAEHYAKQPDGSWVLRKYRGGDARIPLHAIECELHLGSVYDGVMDEQA